MSEEMQPIDPVTAAMLMGKTPDPGEHVVEISHKVLTRLMDVVEFGDQLERVEKDRLLAHLKDVLSEKQPDLWVVHSVGPNELHPMISKKAADQHATELAEIYKETSEKFGLRFDVIPSPFWPLEHFEILAEETIQHRDNLLEYVKELKKPAKTQAIEAIDATLDKLRAGGLSIDGDNAYKRDLLDSVIGAMAFGRQNTNPPPAGHWGQQFWDIGRAEGEQQGTRLAMPAGLHPDTQDLVTRFATALAVKLHAAELKHGYSDGWKEPHWMDECRQKLLEHLAKGDPRDVAAYCAFLWHHCQSTSARAALSATAPCDHQWTDDGQFLLVCTSCGAQEDHDPHWRGMATAPRDGTMVRLLVEFTEHATDDADQAPTIGANNFENDGEDRWQFAGWCWSHDHFTEGKGEPIGWLPMLDEPRCIAAKQQELQQ